MKLRHLEPNTFAVNLVRYEIFLVINQSTEVVWAVDTVWTLK
jgi:hypothetical protein